MEKILVSACLLGEPVRYNGRDKRSDDEVLRRWIREGRVVSVCPEVAGGLPVPRLPAEIEQGKGGGRVINGAAHVISSNGDDVTQHFVAGAQHALRAAVAERIRIAVLKEGSPSCGSLFTYDGTFSGTRVETQGVTAALLAQNGVHVFNELQLAEADALLAQIESIPS